MTKEEFLMATGKQLADESYDCERWEWGILADIDVEGKAIHLEAAFDDNDIKEYVKENYNKELEDDAETIFDFYMRHDREIDAYFIDKQYSEKERKELIEEAFGD